MHTFLTWIDWSENEILRWARVIVVSSLGLLLILGTVILLISLGHVGVWPSVSLSDDLAPISFSAPTPSPVLDPVSQQYQEDAIDNETENMLDYMDEMTERLTPLLASLELDSEEQAVRKYLLGVIGSMGKTLAHQFSSSPGKEQIERLETAVENMVDYVDDMVDHYTEELSEEEENLPLRKQVQHTMRTPLQDYEEAFVNTINELVQQSESEQRRVTAARADGLKGFWLLGVIGIAIVSSLPLLVVLRIDAALIPKK